MCNSRHDLHHAISVIAYHKWQAAGCPNGRDHEFWLAGEAEYHYQQDQALYAVKEEIVLCVDPYVRDEEEDDFILPDRAEIEILEDPNHCDERQCQIVVPAKLGMPVLDTRRLKYGLKELNDAECTPDVAPPAQSPSLG